MAHKRHPSPVPRASSTAPPTHDLPRARRTAPERSGFRRSRPEGWAARKLAGRCFRRRQPLEIQADPPWSGHTRLDEVGVFRSFRSGAHGSRLRPETRPRGTLAAPRRVARSTWLTRYTLQTSIAVLQLVLRRAVPTPGQSTAVTARDGVAHTSGRPAAQPATLPQHLRVTCPDPAATDGVQGTARRFSHARVATSNPDLRADATAESLRPDGWPHGAPRRPRGVLRRVTGRRSLLRHRRRDELRHVLVQRPGRAQDVQGPHHRAGRLPPNSTGWWIRSGSVRGSPCPPLRSRPPNSRTPSRRAEATGRRSCA